MVVAHTPLTVVSAQGYTKTFNGILSMNSLSLEDLKLPEFSPENEVPALIQRYLELVEPQISRVMDSIAAGINENHTTCVAQKVRTRLGTSAPEDVFTMVRTHASTSYCCVSCTWVSRRACCAAERAPCLCDARHHHS